MKDWCWLQAKATCGRLALLLTPQIVGVIQGVAIPERLAMRRQPTLRSAWIAAHQAFISTTLQLGGHLGHAEFTQENLRLLLPLRRHHQHRGLSQPLRPPPAEAEVDRVLHLTLTIVGTTQCAVTLARLATRSRTMLLCAWTAAHQASIGQTHLSGELLGLAGSTQPQRPGRQLHLLHHLHLQQTTVAVAGPPQRRWLLPHLHLCRHPHRLLQPLQLLEAHAFGTTSTTAYTIRSAVTPTHGAMPRTTLLQFAPSIAPQASTNPTHLSGAHLGLVDSWDHRLRLRPPGSQPPRPGSLLQCLPLQQPQQAPALRRPSPRRPRRHRRRQQLPQLRLPLLPFQRSCWHRAMVR
mmetsp:Transcript_46804/g.100237  ORF Transcript_46804/g.100237 Transcript_46804/m.100237 type:complete len:350 (+) Transcript_46804:313-1362(+)